MDAFYLLARTAKGVDMATTPSFNDRNEAPTRPTAARAPTPEKARQGRNVKGMVTVLVVSLVVLLAAYGIMLAVFGGQDDRSPAADVSTEVNSTVEPGPAPAFDVPSPQPQPPAQ